MKSYQQFLESKLKFTKDFGFETFPEELNPQLKPFNQEIVRWALRGGRRAIFASFGLHKTAMQLELMRLIRSRRGDARCLIIMPLGVRLEFFGDANQLFKRKFAISTQFIRSTEELNHPDANVIYLTNYESIRDGKLDASLFDAVSLNEASVLRSYGSKTYQEFLTLFTNARFKFVATAVPRPNREKELIHYAGFLGIMDTGQALTRFFQRDSQQANHLTLYPHMEREFYLWLHSWAIFIQKPSDLGYSDEGYELPEMDVRYHEVQVRALGGKVDRDGQVQLINDAALGLQDAAEEKRESVDVRVAKAGEIVAQDPDNHFILWHDLEAERHAINAALPEAMDVYGSQDMEEREQRITDFSQGKFKYLSTKPIIAGSGCNFQHYCHRSIFVGIGHKFNDFIQSIHRLQRFLQKKRVIIDIIYTETERLVLADLQAKWEEDKQLRARMSELMRKHGLSTTGLEQELQRSIGVQRTEEQTSAYTAVNNDCCDEVRAMEENSIDLIHTSIPFGNHYEYSASYNDFGHNDDNAKFFEQMDYLTPELLRILRPGRIAAIHVKDRIRFGNVTGYGMPTVDPFHAECIFHYRRHGFCYMGMITVVTDVVRENNQTYRLGWSEQCKDGSKMGVGSPEYVLLFRKLPSDTSKAYADVRVEKSKDDYSRSRWQIDAHAFWRSNGDRFMAPEELAQLSAEDIRRLHEKHSLTSIYDHQEHVALGEELDERGALPATYMALAPASHHPDVWHDVNRMRTLNGDQTKRGLVNHICPLQFDIVDRIIRRYTNEGEIVFDPFAGLMTVPYCAIALKRYGYGVELNPEYFRDGLRYLRAAQAKHSSPTLFDSLVPPPPYCGNNSMKEKEA